MKTITKALSMALVLVMCLSIFGASAYAAGDLQLGGPEVQEAKQPVQQSSGLELEIVGQPSNDLSLSSNDLPVVNSKLPAVVNELEAENAASPAARIVGREKTYDSLTEAIQSAYDGCTITVLRDIEMTKNMSIDVSVTINLAGCTINTNGYKFLIDKSAVIKAGTVWGQGKDIAASGASLLLYDVKLDKEPSKNFVPDGYHVVGPVEGWYSIEPGSDPVVKPGPYSINSETYVLNSTDPLFIFIPKGDVAQQYYIGLAGGKSSTQLVPGVNVKEEVTSNGFNWYLYPALKNALSVGTTYYFYCKDATTTDYMRDSMNSPISFTVKKGASPSYGGITVNLRYASDSPWNNGDKALQFRVDGFYSANNLVPMVDGKKLGNLDWFNYHDGYMYLGLDLLKSLASGWHTLRVYDTSYGDWDHWGECEFQIGAQFYAKDTDKHVTGSAQNLKFICSEPIKNVYVGGKLLDGYDDGYFTLSSDRKTLTLTAKFLNNRTAGNTYTVSVDTDSGETLSCNFYILTTAQGSASPKTGDESNIALWATLMLMSVAAAAFVLPKLRRGEF